MSITALWLKQLFDNVKTETMKFGEVESNFCLNSTQGKDPFVILDILTALMLTIYVLSAHTSIRLSFAKGLAKSAF